MLMSISYFFTSCFQWLCIDIYSSTHASRFTHNPHFKKGKLWALHELHIMETASSVCKLLTLLASMHQNMLREPDMQ